MKRAADAVYCHVQSDGSLLYADETSRALLRRKKLRRGALVRVSVSQPRNYQQWKKAHALGRLLIENIGEFERFEREDGKHDSHGALKHLQLLSGIECDDTLARLDGRELLCRTPRSLSFDSMEEGEFQAAYSGFCQYVITRWWPELEPWQIEEMASALGVSA